MGRRALPIAALLAVAAVLSPVPPAAAARTPPPAPLRPAGCTASVPFVSGTRGFAAFRIPAIVQDRGVTVAFAEARRNSAADNGDIEIDARRSGDGGCTWGPLQRVADAGPDTIGNPAPVVDPATGTIWLLSTRQKGTLTSAEIVAGKASAEDTRRVFVQSSRDRGATWSRPREITSSVKRPAWTWIATGPGHGIATASGRLIVAADHSTAHGGRGAELLVSDDHGRTWRIGAVDEHHDGVVDPDETTVAQLPDGRLVLNARNQLGTSPSHRLAAVSRDDGRTLVRPFRPQPALVAPAVEGALLQDDAVTCRPLLFSAPQDPHVRRDLTIRRSTDGVHWTRGPVVAAGLAAYSDMTVPERTFVDVLYETGTRTPYDEIALRRVRVTCPVR